MVIGEGGANVIDQFGVPEDSTPWASFETDTECFICRTTHVFGRDNLLRHRSCEALARQLSTLIGIVTRFLISANVRALARSLSRNPHRCNISYLVWHMKRLMFMKLQTAKSDVWPRSLQEGGDTPANLVPRCAPSDAGRCPTHKLE
jgi:hypothetical protein